MTTPPRSAIALVAAAAMLLLLPIAARAAPDAIKVLRITSNDITSLDPQQGTDLSSTRVAINRVEALYEFDYFAIPAK